MSVLSGLAQRKIIRLSQRTCFAEGTLQCDNYQCNGRLVWTRHFEWLLVKVKCSQFKCTARGNLLVNDN